MVEKSKYGKLKFFPRKKDNDSSEILMINNFINNYDTFFNEFSNEIKKYCRDIVIPNSNIEFISTNVRDLWSDFVINIDLASEYGIIDFVDSTAKINAVNSELYKFFYAVSKEGNFSGIEKSIKKKIKSFYNPKELDDYKNDLELKLLIRKDNLLPETFNHFNLLLKAIQIHQNKVGISQSKQPKKSSQKFTMKQIALIFAYEEKGINRENASEIAGDYGYESKTSGEGLYQDFCKYATASDRKSKAISSKKHENKIKLFESILQHLSEKKRLRANDEIQILKSYKFD